MAAPHGGVEHLQLQNGGRVRILRRADLIHQRAQRLLHQEADKTVRRVVGPACLSPQADAQVEATGRDGSHPFDAGAAAGGSGFLLDFLFFFAGFLGGGRHAVTVALALIGRNHHFQLLALQAAKRFDSNTGLQFQQVFINAPQVFQFQ